MGEKTNDIEKSTLFELLMILDKMMFQFSIQDNVDITQEGLNILSYLWDEERLTINEIGAKTSIDLSILIRSIPILERMGYVSIENKNIDTDNPNVIVLHKLKDLKVKYLTYLTNSINSTLKDLDESDKNIFLNTVSKLENNATRLLGHEHK